MLPAETLKRIALIARVFEAINVLLPSERADAWMRAPNSASIFGGRSALECMMQDGRYGIAVTRQYLLAQIYGLIGTPPDHAVSGGLQSGSSAAM